MDDLKGTITALEKLPFSYGEYVDFVGGRSWGDFVGNLHHREEQVRLTELSKFKNCVSGAQRYFSEESCAVKRDLEIIYLKISVLCDALQMVHDYRFVAKTEFTNVTSDVFRIGVEARNILSPGLWTARVSVDSIRHQSVDVNRNVNDLLYQYNMSTNENLSSGDHYALGTLLFRTFIVNHRQSLSYVSSKIRGIMKQVENIIQSDKTIDRRQAIEKYFEMVVDQDLFSINNLYYKPGKIVISTDHLYVWKNLMLSGLRLLCFDIYSLVSNSDKSKFCNIEKEWLSLKYNLQILSVTKNDAKCAFLYETASNGKGLNKILTELISDQKWLNVALSKFESGSDYKLTKDKANEKKPILNAELVDMSLENSPFGANASNPHIDEIRSLLKFKRMPTISNKLELVESLDQKFTFPESKRGNRDIELKETLLQNSTYIPEGADDDW